MRSCDQDTQMLTRVPTQTHTHAQASTLGSSIALQLRSLDPQLARAPLIPDRI